MKVVLATGVPRVNSQIEQRFAKEIVVVGKPLFREAVESTIKRNGADLVLLSDELEGVTEMSELILLLRARYGSTRIVYIGKKMSLDFKAFLYKYNVYDVLNEKFSEAELREAFFHPKSWEDVSKDIGTLDAFIDEYGKPSVSSNDVAKIERNEYSKIKPATINKDSLYQEIVAFWSVHDQAGKTLNSINSSLFLAANQDLKVLLLDFSLKNPNIHLQFGFQDADRNLGALVEDLNDGLVLNAKTFEQYLITHPVYPNLSILPGTILPQEEKEPEFYLRLLDKILEIAQSMNYSTILIDTDTGFKHPLSIHILRKSTKIYLLVNESTGALSAVSKMFDPEHGEFVPFLIKKKKVFPIVNRATEDYHVYFTHNLDAIIDGNKTITHIKEDKAIHSSVMDGLPLLSSPTDETYMTFFNLCDNIHPSLFKPIKNKKGVSETGNASKKKSIFGKFDKKPLK